MLEMGYGGIILSALKSALSSIDSLVLNMNHPMRHALSSTDCYGSLVRGPWRGRCQGVCTPNVSDPYAPLLAHKQSIQPGGIA